MSAPDVIRLAIGPMPCGAGVAGPMRGAGSWRGISDLDDYYARMTDRFVELCATELEARPGVLELLDVLDDLALPRCIATSSAHATVREHLSAHELTHRFHAVIGDGDYENGKPAPDPYLVAAQRLGCPGRRPSGGG